MPDLLIFKFYLLYLVYFTQYNASCHVDYFLSGIFIAQIQNQTSPPGVAADLVTQLPRQQL